METYIGSPLENPEVPLPFDAMNVTGIVTY
jgi:hypothetical protein